MNKEVYAIVETGGKQYKVSPGNKLEVDFLKAGDGKAVELTRVLYINDGSEQLIGKPLLENAKVTAICLNESKGDKIIVFKYKNKVRYRRKKGHRQLYSRLEINDIVKPGGKTISRAQKEPAMTGGKS